MYNIHTAAVATFFRNIMVSPNSFLSTKNNLNQFSSLKKDLHEERNLLLESDVSYSQDIANSFCLKILNGTVECSLSETTMGS